MSKTIATIQKPVIHYKVFAGGNNPIIPTFEYLGNVVRSNDVVLVGIYTKDKPNMISEDVSLFEKYIDKI